MKHSNVLFQAIDESEDEALKVLQDHPELANTRDGQGLSPLMQALYHGQDRLAAALRHARRRDLDPFEAAAVGDLDRLRHLTGEGAAVRGWSSDGFTALHLAAFFGQPEAAQLLIDRGADIEAVATNRRFASEARPLHSAVAAQDPETTLLLLRAGADPNSKQHGGFTPLLEAAQLGNSVLVGLLLEAGAEPNATLDDGRSAAELAEAAGSEPLASRLRAMSE
jgi:ankyrin repeat protein